MADDQQNPFTMMGMMQMMQPNKYIDPQYKDKPLPLPGYLGTPTDAQGNPIQSFSTRRRSMTPGTGQTRRRPRRRRRARR